MKLSLCIVYIYLVTFMYMHLNEPSTIIAFRSSKNYHYWFLIIWLQSIFILFLSTIFKIFFCPWFWLSFINAWMELISLYIPLTSYYNPFFLYKVIISRFLSLSVWEYISLSIANLSWMPMNLYPPHLSLLCLYNRLNDFQTESLDDNWHQVKLCKQILSVCLAICFVVEHCPFVL